jgi:O-antigen ligase
MVGMRHVATRNGGHAGIIGGWPSGLAIALALVTLSRSGWTELLFLLLGALALKNASFVSKVKRLALSMAAGCVLVAAASYFFAGSTVAETADQAMVSDPHRRTSTSVHLDLMRRGVEITSSNLQTFLIGKGWGSEYEYTKDYFQTTKVGNFHSMYFSMLVQSGFLGLTPFLLLLVRPIWVHSRWVILTPVILVAGVFYQFHGEPFWWIVLVLTNVGDGIRRGDLHCRIAAAECPA